MSRQATQGGDPLSSDNYLQSWDLTPGLTIGRRYARAPIVEAIIELQVVTPEALSMDAWAQVDFGEEYTRPEPVFAYPGDIDADGVADLNHHFGFTSERRDGKRTIQFGPDRFSFTRSGQYTFWDEFIAEVESAWLVYREAAQPEEVGLVGVRFSNHIAFPRYPVEIEDYLRMSVHVPTHLPQGMSELFLQVVIPLFQYEANATITSGLLDPHEELEFGGMLLDIDVKRELGESTNDDSFDGSLRAALDELRHAKNHVFEACITDATRGLIE